jgi:ribosomal protein S18 acetylase RimI-like enzyme
MTQIVTSIRRARSEDAASLSQVFDASWREAYQGVIPPLALARLMARRGPRWWLAAIGRRRPIAVLDIGDTIAGYVSYGRCRDGSLDAEGEIDELYLVPEYQGLGFGTRLFKAVRNDLGDCGLKRLAVWALVDNDRACAFYDHLGGEVVARRTERIAGADLAKAAYLFH